MSDNNRRPILGHGENLVGSFSKSNGGGEKSYPRSYEEAVNLVSSKLESLKADISAIPLNKKLDKVVVAVKLHESFLAKSYTPDTFFRNLDYENIGSRQWKTESGKESKLNFVKINPDNIENNINELMGFDTESFKNDLRKIEDIGLLEAEDIVLGFEDGWEKGRVELVLHPFEDTNIVLEKLFNLLNFSTEERESIKYKKYENGPLFVSLNISKEKLSNISTFNPLRTAHPLKVEVNTFNQEPFPVRVRAPEVLFEPSKKIGIIDGGVDISNPFFKPFVSQTFEISDLGSDQFLKHGTNVTSMALYGDLFDKYDNEKLSPPLLGVESIRAFPSTDPEDIDLYESIDFLEEVIPQLSEIDVFNISVGPVGSILDDDISRFTTALDYISYNYKKLFTVAVGNTGELDVPFNRIQSPADLVNGIGVGAYSVESSGEIIRAKYSSIGFGREGCKVKPDICEHGGSSERPLQVLNPEFYSMSNVIGTSFAAPVVARKAAELMLKSSDVGVLSARALLIQAASNEISDINAELGYGACVQNTDEILTCTENKITILYNNEMSVRNYAKLNIPLPQNSYAKKYKISWTIVTDTYPNPLFSEGYTSTALEDTFYPNENKFYYRFNKKARKMHIFKDADEIKKLEEQGYIKSTIQASTSPNKFSTEADLRSEQKWDTVVKKSSVHYSSTLEHPFIVLHALDRGEGRNRVRYSVAITIEAIDYEGDLYEEVLSEYKVLAPIGIKLESELRISL
ncbi:S8 family peptidase [Lactococcus lactis]|uniref:S8 family peptidase n=1 Tax=Lactococcus lactis TaxID=1358 RepID=A0AB35K9Y2_9LACT|nr:S8 family peptidase [Lactococcus lactis]MDG4978904.1 S8 family peptidase [Lactococcus lactis]MDG5048554.1 S8 family peptidase [Lactococcus lactis]